MKCKYKKFSNERLCQVIYGECQFLCYGYGSQCPIYQNYPNWDKYLVEQEAASNSGIAKVDEAMTADLYDSGAPGPFIVDTLDLDLD